MVFIFRRVMWNVSRTKWCKTSAQIESVSCFAQTGSSLEVQLCWFSHQFAEMPDWLASNSGVVKLETQTSVGRFWVTRNFRVGTIIDRPICSTVMCQMNRSLRSFRLIKSQFVVVQLIVRIKRAWAWEQHVESRQKSGVSCKNQNEIFLKYIICTMFNLNRALFLTRRKTRKKSASEKETS